jgi:hypothetical protein
MHDDENLILPAAKRVPWNKGKLIGPRPALRQNATTRLAARGTQPVASNGMRLDYERQIGCLFSGSIAGIPARSGRIRLCRGQERSYCISLGGRQRLAAALNWRTTPMASEENTKFRQEFGLRVTNLLNRLLKAARVGKDRMKQGDLDVLTAATMELLTMTLANMPEPIRSKRVEGLSATLAADVAKKRERIEQNILAQHLDTPRGSA